MMSLLQQGADFSAENGDFRTPLHVACCGGNLEMVEYLLLSGASVHVKDRCVLVILMFTRWKNYCELSFKLTG
jgi:ankyrin repeat protein